MIKRLRKKQCMSSRVESEPMKRLAYAKVCIGRLEYTAKLIVELFGKVEIADFSSI